MGAAVGSAPVVTWAAVVARGIPTGGAVAIAGAGKGAAAVSSGAGVKSGGDRGVPGGATGTATGGGGGGAGGPGASVGECVVCMDAPRACRFHPCQHAVCCQGCAGALLRSTKLCPVCSTKVGRLDPMGAAQATFVPAPQPAPKQQVRELD